MAMSELMKDSHDKYVERVRNRVWYQRYMTIAKQLKDTGCKDPVSVLKAIDRMINIAHGYGYHRLAVSAYESIEQVCLDMGWVWTD